MNLQLTVLALLTGFLTGAVFKFLQVPIPAPADAVGVMGIAGIFVGYRAMAYLGWGFDLLDAIGF